MRLHDTSQVEKPDQHPLSDLEPRQKRRKSSTDGHVDSDGRSMMMPSNGPPVVEVSDHDFKKSKNDLGPDTPDASVPKLILSSNLRSRTSIKCALGTLNDLENLSRFAKTVCTRAGMDMDTFQSDVERRAADLRNNEAVRRLFDLETVIPARQASNYYFKSAAESTRENISNVHTWIETYLNNPKFVPDRKEGAEAIQITKECFLKDNLQECTYSIIALLASGYGKKGVDGLYDAFVQACETMESDNDTCFVHCMRRFLRERVNDGSKTWRIVQFKEDKKGIPTEYAHIFPETVYLLEYVKEGLRMSFERIAMVLLFPEKVAFTGQINGTALYASHVLLPWVDGTTTTTISGGSVQQRRYTLVEDFFFGSVSIGDETDNVVFVSVEGRFVTSKPDSVFLPVDSHGMIGVKMWIKNDAGLSWRTFSQWQIACMAKYRLTPSEMHSMYTGKKVLTVDHLTMLTLYGQATLLQIADKKQQAANKRPRSRETFTSEILPPISTSFEELSPERQQIAEQCKEDTRGLPMVRLEKGYMESMGKAKASGEPFEEWTKAVKSDVLFFEAEQCIWRRRGDKWIFLQDCMGTTKRNPYRRLLIAVEQVYIHCAVAYTKLYAAALSKDADCLDSRFLHKFEQAREIVRVTEKGDVEIKTSWRSDTNSAVETLVTDHIDQNTGNNRSSNLRMVTKKENTVLAVGKNNRKAIIRKGADDDPMVLQASTCDELADMILDVLDGMDGLPNYAHRTVINWVNAKKPPKHLQNMIKFEDVDIDASKNEDLDGEDDGQDDGIKTNRGLWWYFAQCKAASGTITSQAYRGRQNMISELKSRFGFSSWNKGSYDRFFKDISVSIYPDKSERQAAIKQYLYSSTENNNNGSSSEVLLDLYTSHHLPANRNTDTSTMSVFAVVDKATITDKGVELKDVVSWENELPKFVGDLSDANVSKFVTGRLGKGGLSIKDLENGLKDGNLLCLEFRGWNTRSDKSFASFLENRMGLTEDKAKKEATILRKGYHSREVSPWCHLVFTSRLIAEAKMNQDMRVLYRYRVFHMKNLSGQNNAENAIGKMLCGKKKSSSGHNGEYEVLRSSKEWQTHSFEYKKGYGRWTIDSLNSMMQGIWAEYEFKDALKSVETKRGWRRYKVPGGRGETEFLEYNQDTLDQSAVGKIPYMYLPQSEKDCYVVVVIQRDLPR